ncbi:YybH family protein [Rhizobium terrae]|uniref:YybH family protein n=1 Tax=Rhizobium terrae TaxID=2171756 RepID=UPI000E3C0924|nr:nuclear transport factor 2 family protein [Rhizobium terrae]
MPTAASPTVEEDEIRTRIDGLARALRAKDLDALMAYYAADTVVFDLRPPTQVQSADVYRKNFEAWFASVEGPIDYEIHDLRIEANGDVGFCHSLSHVRSTRTGGDTADYWVRVTSGFLKIKGRWLIAHEHISMPIDLQTMQAQPNVQS